MIEHYEFGSIKIDGKTYDHDVIIHGVVVGSWRREASHSVSIKDVEPLIKDKPKVIIFGTGALGAMKIPKETNDFLIGQGIEVIALKTEEACREYNERAKEAGVLAALHLTC